MTTVTESYVERELKFDLDSGYEPPDVSGLLPDGGRAIDGLEELRSEYFDTPDFALQQARFTLRRRTGSTDTGWQLKVPHDPFRQEIRVDEATSEVPEALQRLLVGVCAGQPLVHVATLTTQRSTRRLVDADGTVLAEIDDDTVRAEVPSDGETATTAWREVEVELGAGPLNLLEDLGALLTHAGARLSDSPSKLTRALTLRPELRTHPDDGTAGAVLLGYLRDQRRIISGGDLALRRGDDSVIHKTRVATRRFRSTVRIFTSLFDAEAVAGLEAEMQWFAGLLGEVRDRQVLEARLLALVEALEPTLILGPVEGRIRTELGRERREHWQSLETAMTSDRYLALVGTLALWVSRPPWSAAAAGPAETLRKPFKHARRTVAKRLERGNDSGIASDLHRARKAAKRARYAAEAIAPVIGDSASTEIAERYEALQDLLGEHQDSIVSADVLRRLGIVAGTTDGENGFTFGILYEREQQTAHNTWEQARREAATYV